MFTGIITDIGTIRSVTQRGDLRIEIATGYDVTSVDMGASIACDGVCLTVVEKTSDSFCVDVSALKVGDELGGHIVSGHVDGVAEIVALRDEGDSTRVTLRAPEALAKFIAPKGSVALNGTYSTHEGCHHLGFCGGG